MAEKIKPIKLMLLGAGSMGGALLQGWTRAGLIAPGSLVIESQPTPLIAQFCRANGLELRNQKPPEQSSELFVIAIKPQSADAVLSQYSDLPKDLVVVSIMAGTSIAGLQRSLGDIARPIVRAMPNLAAASGAGATGLYANSFVSHDARTQIDALMATTGQSVWVADEQQIDMVTAISGSGPAYFFLLAEALEQAAMNIGLDQQAARVLARATAFGAGTLLHNDPRDSAQLREAVTSPGGTTAAALEVLDSADGMRGLVNRAVEAATKRAKALNV